MGDLNIVNQGSEWNLIKHDGLQLENFDISINNLGNGMAKICLIPLSDLRINNPIIVSSKAFLRKEGIDTGEVEPSDMEVETEGGNVKKMCINVNSDNEDWVKFGEESSIVEYQDLNMLSYQLDWAEVNITLHKNQVLILPPLWWYKCNTDIGIDMYGLKTLTTVLLF